MNLNKIPPDTQKLILELEEDEEFQKLFAEDKVLNELEEQGKEEEFDLRMCQLIADYLFEKGKLTSKGILGKLERKLIIFALHK